MIKRLITKFLSKEMDFYQYSVDAFFDRDLAKDMKVFQRQHPKDDFGRSIAQHKCQVYPFKKDTFLLNFASFFFIPVAFIALLLKRRVRVEDNQATLVCYNCSNYPGSLPAALRDETISYLHTLECPYYLSRKDVSFLLRFFIRSFWHPFLSFRVMLKVAKYRTLLDSFSKLQAIAITGEFVDTSSAMTQYCREKGIKHYNFMQGDMFGSPRASFFHFDKCYVWDQHYVEVFLSFGAYPGQFEISMPGCLQKIEGDHSHKTVDYIYFIGGYPGEDWPIIRDAMDKLVEKGYVCEVRPHPRWSDIEKINKVFQGLTIQDTSKVSVYDAILMTKNAIGLSSTVMLQAYYNDVNVVIDDISDPQKFKMLEGYQYIMLNKPHQLLSELTQ